MFTMVILNFDFFLLFLVNIIGEVGLSSDL